MAPVIAAGDVLQYRILSTFPSHRRAEPAVAFRTLQTRSQAETHSVRVPRTYRAEELMMGRLTVRRGEKVVVGLTTAKYQFFLLVTC